MTGRGRGTADRLVARVDAASPDVARAAVGKPWRTAPFRRHPAGQGEGDWPVAAMPASVAREIGARSHTVRLSQNTAAKQSKHRLAPEDYAHVQDILDEGELFADGNGVVGFAERDGSLWRVIVRTFRDGSETYLATFHRARRRDRAAARRRLKRIGRERE